jgi:hypothetical protein
MIREYLQQAAQFECNAAAFKEDAAHVMLLKPKIYPEGDKIKNKQTLTMALDPAFHQALKTFAAEQGLSMIKVVVLAVNKLIAEQSCKDSK